MRIKQDNSPEAVVNQVIYMTAEHTYVKRDSLPCFIDVSELETELTLSADHKLPTLPRTTVLRRGGERKRQ